MKKRISVLMLVVMLISIFTGCGMLESGTTEGAIGKVYKTQWFDFEIKDFEVTYEYNQIDAYEGYKYVVFTIWEKNTYAEPLDMTPLDYKLEGSELQNNDAIPYLPAQLGYPENCMPHPLVLEPKEEAEYDVIFEIPEDIMNFAIYYQEVDIDENIGALFSFPIDLH
ncbi:MAG: hypothetical protein LBM60_02690 [Clostridium sp.]|nr:hypothetical protein [Clostridium sp.]